MKQIIAVIRDENVEPTQGILASLGSISVVILPVLGRGQQKGALPVPDNEGSLGRNAGLHLRRQQVSSATMACTGYRPLSKKKSGPGFLPKHMLIIMAPDEDVDAIIRALVSVNQSGRHGDGKIFVCPIGRSIGVEPDGLTDPVTS